MADNNYKKVMFKLEQDKDGYPPDTWEGLWACKVGPGLFSIDNIPIFVKGISTGDVVSVEQQGSELHFTKLITPSVNSVFRLYIYDVSNVKATRDSFQKLGCESEQSRIANLIAVEIPGTMPMDPVAVLLEQGSGAGRWEYEQGVLRHLVAV